MPTKEVAPIQMWVMEVGAAATGNVGLGGVEDWMWAVLLLDLEVSVVFLEEAISRNVELSFLESDSWYRLILNKVLMLGSASQTIVGRPIVPEAAVHAVVEEHALDAKVIIFKKKRRKNYGRTKGHRQELTKLRITDIQGIKKPEKVATSNPENIAVAA
ncbi:hypothetical protein Q3G72_027740 [Acer saccharum]|nr:hypothetical protein Q3G72_027740 [Acer saccharum]